MCHVLILSYDASEVIAKEARHIADGHRSERLEVRSKSNLAKRVLRASHDYQHGKQRQE